MEPVAPAVLASNHLISLENLQPKDVPAVVLKVNF
ncbi:MAG: hypothetical protein K0R29_855 [Pseudobdellovibrio sp.]|jgi:hypothetical protein|nr:hypothetical protein [Pseudobdellovibrio sp.]